MLPSVPANGKTDEFVNWVPFVGEHTCLKIVAEPQLGEVSVGDNPRRRTCSTSSRPALGAGARDVPVAVRNPRDTDARVELRVWGVPDGYLMCLPYRWVQLRTAQRRQRMDLLIVPTARAEAAAGNNGTGSQAG